MDGQAEVNNDYLENDEDDEFEGEPEPEGDRFEAYYKKGNGNEDKCFDIEYTNPVIEEILHKYNYSSESLDHPATKIEFLEDVIPNYAGVKSVTELTRTLLSIFVAFGKADAGFEKEFLERSEEISESYSSIDGTSCETVDEKAGDFGLAGGYDFKLINGEYKARYRTCDGGW